MSSIKKQRNGKYRARYRDAANTEHAKHFSTKAEGQRWLDEITAAIVTGQYVDPRAGRITFSAYFARWSERQVWAPGTTKAMALAAGSVPFAQVAISAVTRSDIECWVKAMKTVNRGKTKPAGLAPGTIKTRLNNVRAVFRAAVRDRVIPSDPTEGVTLPRPRRASAAMALPSTEQVGLLLMKANQSFEPFVALCAFAGLRLGEAAGLRVGDVDFLRYTVSVSRQVQRENGGRIDIRAPKYGSERTVFVPKRLIEMISAHLALTGRSDPEDWLFEGEQGQPPHQNTVGDQWRKTRAAAKCPTLRLHDLRHFFASGLIADGCDVVTVQRALGHAKPTTTLNTYGHLWPTAEDRTRQAASALMSAALAAPSADSLRTNRETGTYNRRSEG